MGGNHSDLMNSNQVPHYLKPVSSSSFCHSKFKSTKSAPEPKIPKPEIKVEHIKNNIPIEQQQTLSVGSNSQGNFQWYKGRRFIVIKNEGNFEQNMLPNDQSELDRLGVLNFIIRWVLNGFVIVPLENDLVFGINVLNVSFGPGLWSGHHIIDLALDYKNSSFTTVDVVNLLSDDIELLGLDNSNDLRRMFNSISGLKPKVSNHSLKDSGSESDANSNYSRVLSNLEFFQCNMLEKTLPFPDNSYDFVKQQLVTTSYSVKDWIKVLKEIIRVTKPGGYIQLIELDYHTFGLRPEGLAWEEKLFGRGRSLKLMEPRIATYLSDILKAIGLEQVKTKHVSIPLGEWGLELGELWNENFEMFIESSSVLVSPMMGMTPDEYKNSWRKAMREAEKPFSNIHVAYGKKPLEPIDLENIQWSSIPPFSYYNLL